MNLLDNIHHDLNLIRQQHPVIHNVTNFVSMQTIANVLLAAGAAPIMAHASEELSEIVSLANALVINMGTLDSYWIDAINTAQQHALRKKIPIIFDPVGAGASQLRTQTALHILQNGIDILRGNASEIMALVNSDITTKGVDAQHGSNDAIVAAKILSHDFNCVVVISGATDIVIHHSQEFINSHGTKFFTQVTGMGCALTALIGAFCAINKNYYAAACHAITYFTLAGETAAKKCHGPGSFFTALLDELSTFSITTANA